MRTALITSLLLTLVCNADARDVRPAPTVPGFSDKAPTCGDVRWCFDVVLHVVVKNGQPVQTPQWFAHQLAETNRHFAKLRVGFQVSAVRPLPAEFETVVTRADRDKLGARRYTRKVLHVFLVGHLHNVDEPGEIRGVHWRNRRRPRHHWVVLASIAPHWVLAHEIGHFFGLPHSRYPISIMNKSPRDEPPEAERTFAAPEYRRMKRRLRKYLRSRELRPHRKARGARHSK